MREAVSTVGGGGFQEATHETPVCHTHPNRPLFSGSCRGRGRGPRPHPARVKTRPVIKIRRADWSIKISSHTLRAPCQQGSPRGRLPARTHAEARVQQQCATAPPGWLLPSSCRICPEAEPRLVEMRPPPVHSLRHRVGHRRFGAAPHGPIPIIVWREGATRRTWFNSATTARPCDARPKRRSD